jgi:predicted ABC-type ATPase
MLNEIDRLAASRADFAVESTLSGLTLLSRLKRWKASGYLVEVLYLSLPSPEICLQRVAQRTRQGGHDVPRADVIRRFERSWRNFRELYSPIAYAWMIYDNSGATPKLIEAGP